MREDLKELFEGMKQFTILELINEFKWFGAWLIMLAGYLYLFNYLSTNNIALFIAVLMYSVINWLMFLLVYCCNMMQNHSPTPRELFLEFFPLALIGLPCLIIDQIKEFKRNRRDKNEHT